MAEQGNVVAGLVDVRLAPGVDAAPLAFLLVKIPVQVVVGVVGSLKDGIVDLGALHLDPANGVVVLFIDVLIAGEHTRFRGFLRLSFRGGAFCCCLRGCLGLGLGNHLRKLVHPVCLFLAVKQIITNHKGTDAESCHKQEDGYCKECFFHRVPPFLIILVL